MKLDIVQEDTGGKLSFRFDAYCDRTTPSTPWDRVGHCGSLEAAKRKIAGKTVWKVKHVFVNPDHRRQGVATRLYEAAAREACRRRGRLASDERDPGAFSNEFWEKQARKGRATRYGVAFILNDCPPPRLDGVRRRHRRSS